MITTLASLSAGTLVEAGAVVVVAVDRVEHVDEAGQVVDEAGQVVDEVGQVVYEAGQVGEGVASDAVENLLVRDETGIATCYNQYTICSTMRSSAVSIHQVFDETIFPDPLYRISEGFKSPSLLNLIHQAFNEVTFQAYLRRIPDSFRSPSPFSTYQAFDEAIFQTYLHGFPEGRTNRSPVSVLRQL